MFRTYEPTRDRLVAVKVFRLDITPEQARALADELAVAAEAGLFHPSVVEPIAAGVEGTVAYRAEEYVAAESLDVALRHYAPALLEKILPFLAQLGGAIDFARTAGVGHGALHPRDIFVTPDEMRATGFGVVEALERVGLRAPVRRPYSAPERVSGSAWGTPADVFSLAAITYELLTGRRPSGTGGQIGAISEDPADPLHAVLARAMDPDPGRRYPTALAFVSAMESGGREGVFSGAALAGAAAAMPLAAAEEDTEEVVDHLQDRDSRVAGLEPLTLEEPSQFDDVLAERDEDEAHVALIERERARDDAEERERLLFDEEAIEDLALDEPARHDTERFADEFATAGDTVDGDDVPPRQERVHERDAERYDLEDTGSRDEEAAAFVPEAAVAGGGVRADRSRPAMLPIAIVAVLALLVGFAAGYAVRGRTADPAASAGTTEDPAAQQTSGTTDSPKPFSEQAVAAPQPIAEPAPAVGEPAPSAPPTAASRGGTPAPPRATTGRLEIRSTPTRAAVTINGRWRGRTPLTLDRLPFGTQDVRVVQDGYGVAREEVTLSAEAPTRTLSFKLQRAAPAASPRRADPAPPPAAKEREAFTGSIYVDSRPRGARVMLDGKMVGVTPIRIPDVRVGSHVIRLQLEDHRDWTSSTRVTAGADARVTGSLERIR